MNSIQNIYTEAGKLENQEVRQIGGLQKGNLGGKEVILLKNEKNQVAQVREQLIDALSKEFSKTSYVERLREALLGDGSKPELSSKPLTGRQIQEAIIYMRATPENVKKVLNDTLKVAKFPDDARDLLQKTLLENARHPDVIAFLDGNPDKTPLEKYEQLCKVCALAAEIAKDDVDSMMGAVYLNGFSGGATCEKYDAELHATRINRPEREVEPPETDVIDLQEVGGCADVFGAKPSATAIKLLKGIIHQFLEDANLQKNGENPVELTEQQRNRACKFAKNALKGSDDVKKNFPQEGQEDNANLKKFGDICKKVLGDALGKASAEDIFGAPQEEKKEPGVFLEGNEAREAKTNLVVGNPNPQNEVTKDECLEIIRTTLEAAVKGSGEKSLKKELAKPEAEIEAILQKAWWADMMGVVRNKKKDVVEELTRQLLKKGGNADEIREVASVLFDEAIKSDVVSVGLSRRYDLQTLEKIRKDEFPDNEHAKFHAEQLVLNVAEILALRMPPLGAWAFLQSCCKAKEHLEMLRKIFDGMDPGPQNLAASSLEEALQKCANVFSAGTEEAMMKAYENFAPTYRVILNDLADFAPNVHNDFEVYGLHRIANEDAWKKVDGTVEQLEDRLKALQRDSTGKKVYEKHLYQLERLRTNLAQCRSIRDRSTTEFAVSAGHVYDEQIEKLVKLVNVITEEVDEIKRINGYKDVLGALLKQYANIAKDDTTLGNLLRVTEKILLNQSASASSIEKLIGKWNSFADRRLHDLEDDIRILTVLDSERKNALYNELKESERDLTKGMYLTDSEWPKHVKEAQEVHGKFMKFINSSHDNRTKAVLAELNALTLKFSETKGKSPVEIKKELEKLKGEVGVNGANVSKQNCFGLMDRMMNLRERLNKTIEKVELDEINKENAEEDLKGQVNPTEVEAPVQNASKPNGTTLEDAFKTLGANVQDTVAKEALLNLKGAMEKLSLSQDMKGKLVRILTGEGFDKLFVELGNHTQNGHLLSAFLLNAAAKGEQSVTLQALFDFEGQYEDKDSNVNTIVSQEALKKWVETNIGEKKS